MGYETVLHLVDVRIKAKAVPAVLRALKTPFARRPARLRLFLDRAVLDANGFLVFEATGDGSDPYIPDEDDNTVLALYGKWYEAESIARWLKRYAASGSLILHSVEADGAAWGWEFDGKGRMRQLGLAPIGKWT